VTTWWREDEQTARALPRNGQLLHALPEMLEAVPPEDRHLAVRVLAAPLLTAPDGALADVLAPTDGGAFAFVVIDGVVLKETTLAARSALEMLGPGDVLALPLNASQQLTSRAVSRYLAHGPVSLVALDERFRQAARRWPNLSDVLNDRLAQQTHRASMHMAMLHLPRVEDRIKTFFADVGERFGRMTTDGIVIEIRLTHEAIGRLVGSRRPTVSLALNDLAASGELRRLDGDEWLLRPTAD